MKNFQFMSSWEYKIHRTNPVHIPLLMNSPSLSFIDPLRPELSIERLSESSIQSQYVQPGKPLIIKDVLKNVDCWTVDFLRQHLGPQIFPVRQYGRKRYQYNKSQWQDIGSGVPVTSLTFDAYADLILSGEAQQQDLYLARCSLKGTSLANMSDLTQAEQWLKLSSPVTSQNLWCGPPGHTSSLHYDPMDGILIQLAGTKQITLFPPSQLYNLYPFSIWNHLIYGAKRRAGYSKLDPNKPDFQSFPKFELAMRHRIDLTLKPGERLFIPASWWHEVTSTGSGMVCSINRWWTVPLQRTVLNWSKTRAHIGSLLGMPHTVIDLVGALISSDNRQQRLRTLLQRL